MSLIADYYCICVHLRVLVCVCWRTNRCGICFKHMFLVQVCEYMLHVSLFDVELQMLYSNILVICSFIQTEAYVDSGSGGCGCVLVKPGQSSVVTARSLISSTLHTIPQGITGKPNGPCSWCSRLTVVAASNIWWRTGVWGCVTWTVICTAPFL